MKKPRVWSASAALTGEVGSKIDEAAIEVVAPEAMLARIVTEVQKAAGPGQGKSPSDADFDRRIREDVGHYAADLLAKVRALDAEVSRGITASFNVLLASVFLVGSRTPTEFEKHRRLLEEAKAADMRNKRAAKLKPLKDNQAEKYKGAKASIQERGERQTIDRIHEVMNDPKSPHFMAVSRSTVRRLRQKYG
jgi:hypothetical protein